MDFQKDGSRHHRAGICTMITGAPACGGAAHHRSDAVTSAGGVQAGRTNLPVTRALPCHCLPGRPTASDLIAPPFEPAADTCARAVVESSICTRWAVELVAASASNMASNTPDRLSRQKRFQTAFQSPNSAGRARQVML